MQLWRDRSFSAVVAGFIAVLTGYASSAVIIFQAAAAAGANPAEVTGWFLALGVGMGVSSLGLSLYFRAPILTAWSTPGAALLVTSLPGFSLAEATGAFLFSGLLITVAGLAGWVDRLLKVLPASLASAMLGGVLLQFGLSAFRALETEVLLVAVMLGVYLVAKRWWPRYAIMLVLLVGAGLAWGQGLMQLDSLAWELARPVFTVPEWSWSALVGVGVPLFVVTMASQNLPGVAVLRGTGYQTPVSPIITWTGLTTLLLAPFGAFALNLAAITAAICASEESHPDPDKRYVAAVAAGVFYLISGLLAATVAALMFAFPRELVLALAGLALLSTIGNSLATALSAPTEREAALITFLVTASGLTLFSIGSAFWGLVAGIVALRVLRPR